VEDRRLRVGRRGENAAARWYVEHGYEVVARNWRCAAGEIDLLCRASRPERGSSRSTLVVCEVKTRTSGAFGHALEAVTPAKQRRLRRLAGAYLRSQDERYDHIRFDVAAVMGPMLEVVEVVAAAF
jgi:putative endonuclease